MLVALLVLSWVLPLLLAVLSPWLSVRWLPAIAPLPALAAAVLVPVDSQLTLDWLLLGLQLQLDAMARLFLLFSALVWLLAGVSLALDRDPGGGRLRLFFLLTMAGNLLLVLAADMLGFYFGFALMGLSAYGLVAHRRAQRARHAGRVYLAWTLVGELALFAAIAVLASESGSVLFSDLAGRELPALAVALLIFGFGIKLALPGLHFWLPLAYPAAPALAAAVLSGPMINAGLLGWLRFLPPDSPGLGGWGTPLLWLGAVGTALGLVAGLVQRDPRAVLAYSSIAKMGLISAAFGAALLQPLSAPAIIAALTLFAVHHSLAKSALFLGLGEWQRVGARTWLLLALALPALALAGAPLTGGAAAKIGLTQALAGSGLDTLLGLSALGTALLMIRLLWLLQRRTGRENGAGDARSLVVIVAAALALWLPFGPGELDLSLAGLAPVVVAGALALLALAASRHRYWPRFPRGIRVRLVARWLPGRRQSPLRRADPASTTPAAGHSTPRKLPPWAIEPTLAPGAGVAVAGGLWLMLFVLLLFALAYPPGAR